MTYKKRDPRSLEVIRGAIEIVRRMMPEETRAFFTYRTPGVEETDMPGMYSNGQSPLASVISILATVDGAFVQIEETLAFLWACSGSGSGSY